MALRDWIRHRRDDEDVLEWMLEADQWLFEAQDAINDNTADIATLLAAPASEVPTYAANWSDWGGAFQAMRLYRTLDGFCHLEGLAKTAVARTGVNVLVATVGTDFRPTNSHLMTVYSSQGAERLDITSAGLLYYQPSGTLAINEFLSLNCQWYTG